MHPSFFDELEKIAGFLQMGRRLGTSGIRSGLKRMRRVGFKRKRLGGRVKPIRPPKPRVGGSAKRTVGRTW